MNSIQIHRKRKVGAIATLLRVCILFSTTVKGVRAVVNNINVAAMTDDGLFG